MTARPESVRRRRQLAVALSYNRDRETAPHILAKGAGQVAERIIELARENGIPIRDDPDLVESLAQLDLGDAIPPEFYPAVAEVLAYIYRINLQHA